MKKLLLLTLAPLVLTACAGGTIGSHSTEVSSMGGLSIADMRSQVSNKLLIAQVTFHNAGFSAKTGFYRCQFFDSNGMSLGNPQQWQPVTIYPNANQAVKCMATQLQATTFNVQFSADAKTVSIQKSN